MLTKLSERCTTTTRSIDAIEARRLHSALTLRALPLELRNLTTMGKGSNVAKANAARARNAKDQGKSKEEREASKAKAEKDRNAKKCLVCLQTFMISSKDKLLYDHVVAKHDKLIKEPEKCFPHLKGFDPNAPEPTGIAVAQAAAKKKVKKKKEEDLSDLLAAGLNVGKKKK